jgi:hypothetical protein
MVRGMDKDKAQGLYGFSMAFSQDCLGSNQGRCNGGFLDFYARGKFKKTLPILISLIPKVSGASEIKEFHHISLINGIYKIIAKVFANRMRRVVDRVISKP